MRIPPRLLVPPLLPPEAFGKSLHRCVAVWPAKLARHRLVSSDALSGSMAEAWIRWLMGLGAQWMQWVLGLGAQRKRSQRKGAPPPRRWRCRQLEKRERWRQTCWMARVLRIPRSQLPPRPQLATWAAAPATWAAGRPGGWAAAAASAASHLVPGGSSVVAGPGALADVRRREAEAAAA